MSSFASGDELRQRGVEIDSDSDGREAERLPTANDSAILGYCGLRHE
jgi:biotin operon repressor